MNVRRAQWRRILAEIADSNVPVRRFCQERKINESQFYWWRRALARESAASASIQAQPRFVRVAIEPEPPTESAKALELALGRGWVLRIPRDIEESALRSILGALAAMG